MKLVSRMLAFSVQLELSRRVFSVSRISLGDSSSSAGNVDIELKHLRQLISTCLVKENHGKEDADICADTLMYAELRGNNQGVVKLINGALKANPAASEMSVVHESPVSAKINGAQRIGMSVMDKAVTVGLEKVRNSGIAIVGCSGYSSATGAIGYWARKIAQQGYIGIVMSQCNEMVAPHGSYEPIFGTNPIAISIPMRPNSRHTVNPMVLDFATSAEAYFGIVTAALNKSPIRGDIAYGPDGRLTTDPNEALKGAIRVFDRSHKGSGISLMVELLAGALTGAAMKDKGNSKNWGSLLILIDPNIFGSVGQFETSVSEMCDRVKSAKMLPDYSEIYLPGERGDNMEKLNLERNRVTLSHEVYEALVKMSLK